MPRRTTISVLKESLREYNHFSLKLYPAVYEFKMTMCMNTPVFHTCDIPATYKVLKTFLPSIFHSKCFNENKYTFTKEVKNTEIGHLFEHILLEYLCIEKMSKGFSDAEFNGVTNWNWVEDPKGTFHIIIDASWKEHDIFYVALERSIVLLTSILDTKQIDVASYN